MVAKDIDYTEERLWSRDYILLTISAVGAGFLYSFFSSTLPIYAEQITGTAVWAGMVSGIYFLASVATRPIAGFWCSKYDKIKLCIIGLAIMTAMCLAYNWAYCIALLLIMRVIHGIGFGVKGTASGVAVVNIIPQSRMAEGIAIYGAYVPLCSIIGPALGLAIIGDGTTEKFKTLFLLSAAIGAASTILLFGLKERELINRDIKMEDSSTGEDLTLPKTWLGFEMGVLVPSIVLFLVYMGQGCVVSFIAMYNLHRGWGAGGSFFVVCAMAQFISRLINSRTIQKIGYDKSIMSGIVVFTIGIIWIPFASGLSAIRVAGGLIGAGVGFIPAALNAIMFERCTVQRRGSAQAAYASALDIGLAGGAILLAFVLELAGYKTMFLTAAALSIGAGVIYAVCLWGARKKLVSY